MIALLSCSTSWCQSKDTHFSTGEVEQTDSLILIPIDAIKIANSKMIELQYEKEINSNLRTIINNDSIVINNLNKNIELEQRKSKRYKRQRNFVSSVGIGTIILFIVSLF